MLQNILLNFESALQNMDLAMWEQTAEHSSKSDPEYISRALCFATDTYTYVYMQKNVVQMHCYELILSRICSIIAFALLRDYSWLVFL